VRVERAATRSAGVPSKTIRAAVVAGAGAEVHVAGQNRAHHRRDPSRAVSLQASQTGTHPQEELWQDTSAWSYEPQFSDFSHGFRPRRGCHTALREIVDVWKGTHWFIEGDIANCFGSLDHQVMLDTLAEKIHDGRFPRLLRNMLQAGYLEDWRWNATLSSAPGCLAGPVQHLPAPFGQLCGDRNYR